MASSNLRKTRAGVETGTVRIKCFVQEHTDSVRSRIRISRLGVQRTNNEATASMVTYLWHERWIPIGEQIYPLKSLGSLWALRRLPVETVSIWKSIVPGQICWKKMQNVQSVGWYLLATSTSRSCTIGRILTGDIFFKIYFNVTYRVFHAGLFLEFNKVHPIKLF